MQKPFAYSPAQKIAQHFILTGRQISIITIASAILLFMVSVEFVHLKYADGTSSVRSPVSSSSELATGMPLP
jgi:hypothetical protein